MIRCRSEEQLSISQVRQSPVGRFASYRTNGPLTSLDGQSPGYGDRDGCRYGEQIRVQVDCQCSRRESFRRPEFAAVGDIRTQRTRLFAVQLSAGRRLHLCARMPAHDAGETGGTEDDAEYGDEQCRAHPEP